MSYTKKTVGNGQITIAMPIYNSEFIVEAIESVIKQTYQFKNIVLYDNGSSIETNKAIRKYKNYNNITIIESSQNNGLIDAWNKCARISHNLFNSEFFMWASDHDTLPVDFVEMCVLQMRSEHDVVLVAGAAQSKKISVLPNFTSYSDQIRHFSLSKYDAGELIYGVFKFDALMRTDLLPYQLFPDRLLISLVSTIGKIKRISKRRMVRNKTFDKNLMLQRQQKTLFGSSLTVNPSLLSHALYHLKNINKNDGPYSFFNAILFYKRAVDKWGDDPNFSDGATAEDIFLHELYGSINNKTIYPYLSERIKNLKKINAELVEKIDVLVKRKEIIKKNEQI